MNLVLRIKLLFFSRDEAKQHAMRVEYQHKQNVTMKWSMTILLAWSSLELGISGIIIMFVRYWDADIVINALP
jgi:hypothetical protein